METMPLLMALIIQFVFYQFFTFGDNQYGERGNANNANSNVPLRLTIGEGGVCMEPVCCATGLI